MSPDVHEQHKDLLSTRALLAADKEREEPIPAKKRPWVDIPSSSPSGSPEKKKRYCKSAIRMAIKLDQEGRSFGLVKFLHPCSAEENRVQVQKATAETQAYMDEMKEML